MNFRAALLVFAAPFHGTRNRGSPDIIVLDPQMKGLDGLQLLKQLRVTDQTIPVIIVTGESPTSGAMWCSSSSGPLGDRTAGRSYLPSTGYTASSRARG